MIPTCGECGVELVEDEDIEVGACGRCRQLEPED